MPPDTSSSAAREVFATAWLLAPLLVGALVHGLCMKHGWLGFLARPIDGGRLWRGRPIFGHSKTFRGPVCMAAGAAAGFAMELPLLPQLGALAGFAAAATPPWWVGALAGAAGELTELPNSFVKRRLGIAPGGTARGPLAALFYAWDQLDLLLGFWLVLAVAGVATPVRVAISLLLVGAVHPLATLCGYLLGMRTTAR